MSTTGVERARIHSGHATRERWRRWGPYVSNRAWGTVREDYSDDGDAWRFLPHDMARSKAFRWGEDGIAGFCDRFQQLCWSLALWNERDPILKERFYGLDSWQGNHGEDVKECFYYLDALPSHAYQRMLYKYPQSEFPYQRLQDENRGRSGPEFELIDTGVFDEGRYWDVEIEIAKADLDDIVLRVTAHNRGPDRAAIQLIPQLWYRNVWSWGPENRTPPIIRGVDLANGRPGLLSDDSSAASLDGLLADPRLGPMILEFPEEGEALFTDNETNAPRVFGPGFGSARRWVKDAFHRRIVDGDRDATNPDEVGTKAGVRFRLEVEPGESATIRLRLAPSRVVRDATNDRLAEVDDIIALRRSDADEFYESIHPAGASEEERNVQRQAFAGMLWNKQIYLFDVERWLDGDDPAWPPSEGHRHGRNFHWRHLNSMRILSMPDKWEYPWFAAWDLAFHAVTLALVDAPYAKEQLWLMLFEQFQHPNGQIPAYEWEFSDLNPPVHAWGVWRVYNMDRIRQGVADRDFLEKCFHKLLLNFTWWVNKVDPEGNNIFEGGFLGLDNITVIDRSEALDGVTLEQSDATGWMGMFCLVMMRIALELAKENHVYEGLATKFFEHYVYVGAAMKLDRRGATLWDENDEFFYDILRFPDGSSVPFSVRSLVGIIPLYAIERLEEAWVAPFTVFKENLTWFLRHRPEIVEETITTLPSENGNVHVLAVVDGGQLQCILGRVVDPEEFLSPHGMRSLSRSHLEHPFQFGHAEVRYEPGEALTKLKGGNSNWRGPVWFPTSFLMIETLRKLEKAYGGELRVKVSDEETGQGLDTLPGLAGNLADRMIRIFVPDAEGRRPLYGPPGTRKSRLYSEDPHWNRLVLFHEYFHGDTGEGLGASHQCGWTGLVANLIDEWRH